MWYDYGVGPGRAVLDVGPTGFAGTTGWYIPSYLVDPKYFDEQLDYWRMFRLPEVAAFFATAATNYSSGEFTMNYEAWGPEQYMLTNLKMNFTAIYYGDAFIQELFYKYPRKEPIFIYLWTPYEVSDDVFAFCLFFWLYVFCIFLHSTIPSEI